MADDVYYRPVNYLGRDTFFPDLVHKNEIGRQQVTGERGEK